MVGLTNEGNTCFFNAALACFLYTPYVSNNYKLLDVNDHFNLSLKNFISSLFDSEFQFSIVCSTKDLYAHFQQRFPQFRGNYQHDTHEAFMCLVSCLPSKLQCVFEGRIKTHIKCNRCNHTSTTREPFNTICLSDHGVFDSVMKQYFENVHIDNYECNVCKQSCNGTMCTSLSSIPKVLVFKTRANGVSEQIMVNKTVFSLYAYIVYKGNGSHGHYFCYVKSHGLWYCINDTVCGIVVDTNDLNDACVLFYLRKN